MQGTSVFVMVERVYQNLTAENMQKIFNLHHLYLASLHSTVHGISTSCSWNKVSIYLIGRNLVNSFRNDKFQTLPKSNSFQTTVSNLMKIAESSSNG